MSEIIQLDQHAGVLARSRVAAFIELTKPRIAGMVLFAAATGFYLALPAAADPSVLPLLAHTLWGTLLVAGGANALNQYLEAPQDRRMERTRDRPLPSRRLASGEVLTFAIVISAAGILHLALFVNLLSSLLSAFALFSYVFMYTPLKRRTWRCVFVGAVAGALPPVIGWAAGGEGTLTPFSWLLFIILFFWQLPHFAAIAWLYREDYARAVFPLLCVTDRRGARTTRHMLIHTLGLLAASVLPVLFGFSGTAYACAAALLGTAFLGCGVLFAYRKTKGRARFHLLGSVLYLPSLFVFMMIDKASLP